MLAQENQPLQCAVQRCVGRPIIPFAAIKVLRAPKVCAVAATLFTNVPFPRSLTLELEWESSCRKAERANFTAP